jgi:hypothetical protein
VLSICGGGVWNSQETKRYRLGVARPFLMLKALFLILPLILPFKH